MTAHGLTICADDYGISEGTSQVVLDLLNDRIINATTCLVETTSWPALAKPLRSLADREVEIGVGLHLNLTERFPACAEPDVLRGVSQWIVRSASISGRSNDSIYNALHVQWMLFVEHFGRNPDFVDGHQHVHLFRPVRRMLLRLAREMCFQGWMRQCRTTSGRIIAHRIVLDPSSVIFEREAKHAGVPVNRSFGGLRRFRRSEDLEALWTVDINAMRGGGLLVVHPGASGSPSGSESIDLCRIDEARLLRSGRLQEILRRCEAGRGIDDA